MSEASSAQVSEKEQIASIVQNLITTFNTQKVKTKSLEWKLKQLQQMKAMLLENKEKWELALEKDLGAGLSMKSVEVMSTSHEIETAMDNLASWVKPKQKNNSLILYKPGSAQIVREPYGVVLIISPWNYPVGLLLKPLVGAISAGNCAVLKPSEVSTHVEKVFAELIPKYMDPQCIQIVTGGPSVARTLLEDNEFDYIFYTGSTNVGKIVMQAAAKNLTPVTLELGGKSPCIVDKDLDLDVSVRRIAFGKFMNCGQTCVAPDYIFVHEAIQEKFINKLKETIVTFFGQDASKSADFSRIINHNHFDRIMRLVESSKEKIVFGGKSDRETKFIEPTIILNPSPESAIMQEEIFGPVIPILTMKNVNEAIQFITARPKPLALYCFSSNSQFQQLIIDNTTSGGLSINETLLHVGHPELPFGGVGASGMGAYNGKATYKLFSHAKSVYSHATWVDPSARYPPMDPSKMKMTKVAYSPIAVSTIFKLFE